MNVTRVLGAFAVGLVALGAITAQADSRYWIGKDGDKWSAIESWDDGLKPTAADMLSLNSNDKYVIDVDETSTAEAPLLGNLYGGTGNSTTFFNSDPTVTNEIYTASGLSNTFNKDSVTTVKGANIKLVLQGTQIDTLDGSTLIAADGARLEVANARFVRSGKTNYGSATFVATNGAYLKMATSGTSDQAYPQNKTLSLQILDHSEIAWAANASGKGLALGYENEKINVKMTSSYASLTGISINKATANLELEDSEVKFSTFTSNGSGTSIRLVNSRLKTNWSATYGGNAATVYMSGRAAYIRPSGGGFTVGAKAVFTLVPELNWDEKNASPSANEYYPLIYQSSDSGNSVFTSGWKCNVDVTKFAHYYGTKKILFAYTATTKTKTLNLPAVTVIGEGAENCKVTFSTSDKNKMWMTIESQNPPEGSVARIVRNGTKYYYNSLEEAFAAAQENDTVSPIANVSLTNTVTVGKAVTLDPNTFCVSGDSLAAAPFIVTDGALTVSGSGTIDGGANAAVRVTGGAFYSPVASQVTYSSANDAIVVYNAGTAPTVEICGGNFVSTEGQPVASSAAEGSDPLVGFLEGGTYNKEPTAVLIRDGYKSQQVGDLWEVVLEGPAICKVGDRYYASLQKAYDAVPNYGDIFIVADATVAPLTLNRKIDVGIDVSGHTLTSAEGNTLFTVEGDALHLWDNPTSGPTGSFNGGVVLNSGTLEIDVHVTIKAEPALTVNGGTADKVFGTLNGGVVMNGGSLTLNATVNSEGVAISANGGALNVASGSYTGGTSAFVAGPDFTAQCVDTGSFSSAIPAQHLKGNRKMEQQGGVWVVMLASDEKNVTYTWQGGAVGDWANPANWKPSLTPCFGVPSNKYATASFASSSANIVVNLGGGDYPIGALSYAHYYRQTITNGSFKLQSGALNGDRRLIVKDAVVTVADPVYANAQGFNFQLNGDAKVVGDVAPHKDAKKLGKYDESYNGLVCIGSNEVTGVVHNRNTQLNVNVQEDSTLVVGEIKSDSNSTYLTPVITVAKTGKLNVRECKSGDFSGGIKFTFNVPATGLDSAPVSFLKNDDNVGLTEYTALTVNVDEGFKTGRIPLISGTWLSANDVRKILSGGDYGPLVVNGKFPKGTKFGLQSKNGVISLLVKSAAMVISVQ